MNAEINAGNKLFLNNFTFPFINELKIQVIIMCV